MFEESAQHYQRAAAAMKDGDADLAIKEFDLYLCSNPPPDSSMIAWFNLNTAIVQKFDFPNREETELSDEEFLWQRRAEKCLENVIHTYETIVSQTEKGSAYQQLYQRAKDRLKRTAGFGELVCDAAGNLDLRSTEVIFRVTLPPLNCLAGYEKKAIENERRIFENNSPLKGGKRMQDVVSYFVHGLKFAEQNRKLPAAQFLTKVVENLDGSDAHNRKVLETAHFRLAVLESDLGNGETSVKHAQWILKNAPPDNEIYLMMMNTILELNGHSRDVVISKRSKVGSAPAASSGTGCLFAISAASLLAIALLTALIGSL